MTSITLTREERETLQNLLASGTAPARTLTHARILLKADEGEGGLEAALPRKAPEREWECRLDGAQEAHLIALACSEPPDGREQWSLRLLAGRMVKSGHVEALSHETVRRVLKKGNSNPG